jgi:hypothetical protein
MTDGGFAPPDQPNTPEEPLPEKEQELIAHVRSQLADLDRLGRELTCLQARNFPCIQLYP